MVIPWPFTKALFVYGEAITVPRYGDVEEWRVRVQNALNELSDRAEAQFDELWSAGD